MNSSSPPNWTLVSIIGPLFTALGIAIKTLYQYWGKKRALFVDDGTQLRRDLLEERKTLLNQLLSERTYYSDKISALDRRMLFLEEQNHTKDAQILNQQLKLNHQAIQIDSQQSLIEALRSEIDELKSNGKTASHSA